MNRLIPILTFLGLAWCTRDTALAQTPGTCEPGTASAVLDVNNVHASLNNTGRLFGGGEYVVPKVGAELRHRFSSVFASSVMIAGLDRSGGLRFAGTTYDSGEFWPGPLDTSGNPPIDCSEYDHVFSVKRSDLELYDRTGTATSDMIDWPWQLGAPVVDGDGNPDNYDLQAGDRPDVIGDQIVWWVMNDAGNVKSWSGSAPLGVEVQVSAFAFHAENALDNTTFYRYRVAYRGSEPLTKTYIGIWVDPDLGSNDDDYVGADTTLGLGFAYNGSDFDPGGIRGYGLQPPAVGVDLLQGPLVPDPAGGTWVDPDGTTHPGMSRMSFGRFVYMIKDRVLFGDPLDATDSYNYLRGYWTDGSPMTYGGDGYGGTEATSFAFPGDPVTGAYWSAMNTDGMGSHAPLYDRRFVMSTGSFDLKPGDVQEIVFAIVWSRALDRIASVDRLRMDDRLVQSFFDGGFSRPARPDPPVVSASTRDGTVVLTWSNPPESNNFFDRYDEPGAYIFAEDPSDLNRTYAFAGYRVLQFASADDSVGTVIGAASLTPGADRIVDERLDVRTGLWVPDVFVDNASGQIHFHVVDGLVNFREYHFGVQAFALNVHARPRVLSSRIARVTAIPAPVDNRAGGTVPAPSVDTGTVIPSVQVSGSEDGHGPSAWIFDPAGISGHMYEFSFFEASGELVYDLRDETSDEAIVSGRELLAAYGFSPRFGIGVVVRDGLSFNVDRLGIRPGDVFRIDTAPYAPSRGTFAAADDSTRQAHLDLVGAVPNPYRGASAYERSPVDEVVRFVNLPDEAVVRIYTLSGTHVRTLTNHGGSTTLDWDLRNEHSMRVGSGMYLVHIAMPELGEKVIKLGVVRGRLRVE